MVWLNELRYTLKILGKNFRFTLLCVSVIFVGVAIVLPTYALIDNLALKSPSFAPGDEYVMLSKELREGMPGRGPRFDAFHLQAFRAGATRFKALHAWRDRTATLSDGEYAEGFSGAEIEPELLQRLQVQPLLGRLLLPADAASTDVPVALISHAVWQTYYVGREDIVGHQSRINGELRNIVGVMPEGFGFPVSHRVWLPLTLAASANPGEGAEDLAIAGILAEGAGISEADAEVGLLQAALLAEHPEAYPHIEQSRVLPYISAGGGDVDTVILLSVLGSIVLLVTCNIGNLFVARSEERIQELAVRSALGATPVRVALSLLLESFLVCSAGLLAGWAWAYFGIAWINGILVNMGAGMLTEFFWWDLSLNGRMLIASTLMMVFVWLGSGGLPAWRICRSNLNELLNGGSKGLAERGTTRLNKILVNVQLVLGSVLLTMGITLFILSFGEQITTRSDSDNLYTGRFAFNATTQTGVPARQTHLDTMRQALLNQPGVDEVAFASTIPGNGAARVPYGIEDQELRVNDAWPTVFRVFVTDQYFSVIDVNLVQGRGFGVDDTEAGLPVTIIDQRLAERLWPGESALGKRIRINPDDDSPWLTIIGVAAPSVLEGSLREGEPGLPVVYQSIRQSLFSGQVSLLVAAKAAGFDYRNAIRDAAAQADRDVPVSNVQSFEAIEQLRAVELEFNRTAFYSLMLIAVYLTAAATYGLAARAAGRRRIETGIRMALGASPAACIRVFLQDGCRMVVYGLGIGGILAIGFSYLMIANSGVTTDAVRSLLPTTLLLALVMGVLVLLANYLPARKIVAMEPADALRYE